MSCAASTKIFLNHRFMSILIVMLLISTCMVAQTDAKTSQATPEKKTPAGKNKKKSSAENQEKKTAAEPTSAEKTPSASDGEQEENKGPWHGLTWRLIGPFRGGRVLAVSGVVGDQHTYYFGGTGGGVWKSTDGGLTWRPLTDKVKDMAPSIGAIAVAPSDSNVIYAGTGEACIRGDIINGNGVYKSVDAGKTWTYSGLKETRTIGRIAVNPKNPDIAYVAALGHVFGANAERGIYRTTDGGKNWTKVLYKDENSGGIDLSMDPNNSNVIFASLWQARRTPWGMDSGGPGSGLYRSTDGGTTWKHLTGV